MNTLKRILLEKRRQALVVGLIILIIVAFSPSLSRAVFAEKSNQKMTENDYKTENNEENKETVYIVQNPAGHETKRIVDNDGKLKYKGYEDCKLPVTMNIKYFLNDKEISSKSLKGKKGHLRIEIEYTNNVKKHGKYVPFMVSTGIVFSEDNFSNVKVKEGRIIKQGKGLLALGMAFPGLQENLKVSSENLSIPKEVTFEADTTNYDIDEIYSYVSGEPFKDVDFSDVKDLKGLKSKIDEMRNSGKKLSDGTSKLKNGTSQLANGGEKLYSGSKKLENGAKQVADGNASLKNNIPKIMTGINDLAIGAKTLQNGNDGLYNGLLKMYGKAPSSTDPGSGTKRLEKGTEGLVNGSEDLVKGLQELGEGLDKAQKKIETQTAGLNQLKAQISNLENMVGGMIASLNQSTSSGELENKAKQLWAKYDSASDSEKPEIRKEIIEIEKALGKIEVAEKEKKQLQGLKGGLEKISNGLSNMGSGNEFSQLVAGAGKLEEGSKSLNKGAAQINAGIKQINTALAGADGKGTSQDSLIGGALALKNGAAKLSGGFGLIDSKSVPLVYGVNKLGIGSAQLYNGLEIFTEKQSEFLKGVNKIAEGSRELDAAVKKAMDKVNKQLDKLEKSDILSIIDNAKATSNAAKDYRSFEDGKTYDQVSFIYKTEN